MTKNPQPPTLQGVIASLLWLSAHPDRRICLYHQTQMLMQMRYLADYPGPEIEPLLRTVAIQLAEQLEVHMHQQLAEAADEDPPSHRSWIN